MATCLVAPLTRRVVERLEALEGGGSEREAQK